MNERLVIESDYSILYGLHERAYPHRMRDKRQKGFFDYKNHRPWAENLQIVMQLGLTMAGCIIFCFFLGWFLDRWLGTGGVFVSLFILLGVLGGANVVYRQIMEIIESDKQKQDPKDPPS